MPETMPKSAESKKESRGKRVIAGLFNAVGRIRESRNEQIEEKHKKRGEKMAAFKGFGKLGLIGAGVGILLVGAGVAALPFWGMKELLKKDRDFMRGLGFVGEWTKG